MAHMAGFLICADMLPCSMVCHITCILMTYDSRTHNSELSIFDVTTPGALLICRHVRRILTDEKHTTVLGVSVC